MFQRFVEWVHSILKRLTAKGVVNKDIVKLEQKFKRLAEQAKPSQRDPRYLDPRTITEKDVAEMLENASFGAYDDGTYIPLRRNTPEFFINVVKEHSKGEYHIEDYPIASKVRHLRQNMEEEDGQSYGEERPHELSVDDIIAISRKMGDPSYIVLQENERYAEVVSFYNKRNKKVVVVIDMANSQAKPPKNFKYSQYMNGYDQGYYNIVITQYEPDDLQDYLSKNEVVYDKKEMNGKYQVGSGRIVTVTHDTPFIEDIIPQDGTESQEKTVKKQVKKDSLGNELSEGQIEYFKDSKIRDEKGRLIPVYHGSKSAGFTEFTKSDEIGYFFARTIKTSKTYAGGSKAIYAPDKNSPEFSGAANYKVYLDIKKPYIIDGNGANWNQLEANGERVDISIKSQKWNNGSGIAKIQFKYNSKTYSQTVRTSEEFESFISKHTNPEMAKAFAYAMGQVVDKNGKGEFNAGFIWDFKNSVQGDTKNTRDIVRKAYNSHWNYDGVIFKNVVDSGDGSKIKADDLYVVFDSNQIKSVNNTNPTEDKDIRYSLPDVDNLVYSLPDLDSSGQKLSAGQREYFKDSLARDEYGNLLVLYHGTSDGGFTK